MKIGLLVCDHIQKDFPDYPTLFKSLFPQYAFEIFNVCDGVFPESAYEFEAWLITGSKFSVYDDIDWITRLKTFVKEIYIADKYCIGICFGHQMLGEAMGGKVTKSVNGWCVGAHEFEVLEREDWMKPFHAEVNLLMSCQDQITVLPENSKVLAQSSLCPVGMIKIGKKMLGVQGHPEFSNDYARSLMEDRANRIGAETVIVGIESLNDHTQSLEIAEWIKCFLNQ